MPVENIKNHPSFGICCKPRVCRQLINMGQYFDNAEEIVATLPYIGSNSTRLSNVRYTEEFWDNIEDCGAFSRAWLTFKLKMGKKVTTLKTKIDSRNWAPTNIHPKFVEAVKEIEQKYITSMLKKAASKGELVETLGDLNKHFPNHKTYIEETSSKFLMENRIANDIKREKAVKKQKIIDFIKGIFKF